MSLETIKEFLREAIGLDPETVGTSIVDSAITKHMKALETDDVTAYLSLLKSSPVKTKELIDLVVVNETWFFRQPEAFTCLRSIVGKKRKSLTIRKRLRILCLGCSTGEEPYSIAMTLKDMGIEPKYFLIDAVDISEKVIQAAESGIYGASSFDNKDDLSFRENHFIKKGRQFELKQDILDCVSFVHGNILHHTCPLNAPQYDMIFCRHVVIYLCDDARLTLLKRLAKLLVDDGTVFIGASETSMLRNNGYTACKPPSAFAFQKTQPDAKPAITEPTKSKPDATKQSAPKPAGTKTASKFRVEELEETKAEPLPEYCWLINGISGDRSCEKLAQYIRCYNCPVRIEHGRHFLDRESSGDYLSEWKENLAQEEMPPNRSEKEHTVVFRLGNELFGIPSLMVKDISGTSTIHSIPYRTNEVLLGMANFSGELRLCVSLDPIIGTTESDTEAQIEDRRSYKRMVTMEEGGNTWSFPVDEIIEIQNIFESDVIPPVEQSGDAIYIRGTTTLNDRQVSLIDHQLLVEGLKRGIR